MTTMTTKDYIFEIFGEPHVALLDTNQVQKVIFYTDDFIRTSDDKLYYLNKENFTVLVRNSIPNKFWTATTWLDKCLSGLM